VRVSILAGLGLVALSAAAIAADDKDAAPPAVFQAVLDCEKLSAPQERLACFDRAVAAMAAASRARELAVFDRSTMREARRGIFGLGLPSLKIFGSNQSEEVMEIDSTITGLRTAGDGMPVFVLEDGARWKQTDGRNVFAKIGHPIHIKRAALGSYVANVNKRPGVRVVRQAN
jgi:hypothetical protein